MQEDKVDVRKSTQKNGDFTQLEEAGGGETGPQESSRGPGQTVSDASWSNLLDCAAILKPAITMRVGETNIGQS